MENGLKNHLQGKFDVLKMLGCEGWRVSECYWSGYWGMGWYDVVGFLRLDTILFAFHVESIYVNRRNRCEILSLSYFTKMSKGPVNLNVTFSKSSRISSSCSQFLSHSQSNIHSIKITTPPFFSTGMLTFSNLLSHYHSIIISSHFIFSSCPRPLQSSQTVSCTHTASAASASANCVLRKSTNLIIECFKGPKFFLKVIMKISISFACEFISCLNCAMKIILHMKNSGVNSMFFICPRFSFELYSQLETIGKLFRMVRLLQLDVVDMRHAPSKLPSKLHLFASVDVLSQSLCSLNSDCASKLTPPFSGVDFILDVFLMYLNGLWDLLEEGITERHYKVLNVMITSQRHELGVIIFIVVTKKLGLLAQPFMHLESFWDGVFVLTSSVSHIG
ncbi:hypothetical protein VP01_3818g3 [Puccinia sorghi]|uniref:Uncharacterized protein n=1 Tax=Puccinia sorghi TaxID=27349 RepID=A0A0L6UT95_9BASI|nr:hypothetical protein VP01_3818g3 [Puccinia sorghi]